jgi:hypothetical protein
MGAWRSGRHDIPFGNFGHINPGIALAGMLRYAQHKRHRTSTELNVTAQYRFYGVQHGRQGLAQSIRPALGQEAQAPAPHGPGAPEGAGPFERGAKVESNCSNCLP